jgi:hypothetical protein
VTGVLAAAAWRALYQLEEVKRDRHVEVLDAMGRRWESDQMTEALQMEVDHTPESLVRRVPNYFEDAATIARAGSLESSLVTETFGGVARDEWSLWRPAIKKLQETDPLAYVEFERMAEEAD